ncbi:craniofacial development protein 2-like [Macrobrachium rosenbergii]|uniref:craniofacial development protein 2-like n=1 Tax=Macrobrachium rosenbergii TaxID=79674 RepID=UPI0034D49ED8
MSEVQRISDRLMGLKFVNDRRVWHIISAYAPQQGCSEEEKEEFRGKLEECIERVPRIELLVLSGDMNAHVGESSDGFEGIHGGRGFGRRNQGGERLLELAEAMNLVVLNTQFEKRSHLVTYSSGHNETQIDYVLVRKEDKKIIMDCKVIPNESVVAQHKLAVADFRLKAIRKRTAPARNRRIKTWKLKGRSQESLKVSKKQSREICEWNVRMLRYYMIQAEIVGQQQRDVWGDNGIEQQEKRNMVTMKRFKQHEGTIICQKMVGRR